MKGTPGRAWASGHLSAPWAMPTCSQRAPQGQRCAHTGPCLLPSHVVVGGGQSPGSCYHADCLLPSHTARAQGGRARTKNHQTADPRCHLTGTGNETLPPRARRGSRLTAFRGLCRGSGTRASLQPPASGGGAGRGWRAAWRQGLDDAQGPLQPAPPNLQRKAPARRPRPAPAPPAGRTHAWRTRHPRGWL